MRAIYSILTGAILCSAATSVIAQAPGQQVPGRPPVLLAKTLDYYYYDEHEQADAPSDTAYNGNGGESTDGCASCGDGCGDCVSAVCDGCNGCGCNGGCCCKKSWCNIGEAFSLWSKILPCEEPAVTVGGWVQMGYHSNNTPLSNNRGDVLSFNDVPNGFNLHQGWLYAEKAIDTSETGMDWGFRGDLMYGTDAQKTQAFGNPAGSWDFQNGWDHGVYGWAIPQLYGEVGIYDLSVKVGHFYTLVGYEVVTAPDNFFYSHALTMFNSEPFTHTGVLATYSAYEDVTFYGGWTSGWDTGFDSVNGGSSFLGGISVMPNDEITVTYIATGGNFGARGDDGYSHSVVADFTVSDKINYVFQSDLVRVTNAGDDDVGINQYLFYTVNDCIKLGGRLEWWKDEGISYYEATAGVNVRAHANLVLRPEIRYDWTPTTANPNVAYAGGNRTTFGIDAVLTY